MGDAYGQGLAAYAAEQAAIQRGIKAKYHAQWGNFTELLADGMTNAVESDLSIEIGLNASEDESDEDEDDNE